MKRGLRILVTFLFLAAVTAAAVCAAIRNARIDRMRMELAEETKSSFPEFNPDEVRSFTIAAGEQSLELKFQNGVWQIPSQENALASRTVVVNFLSQLARTRPLRELQHMDEDGLKDLNLSTEPGLKLGMGAGVTVALYNAEGKEIYHLILGKAHIKAEADRLGSVTMQSYDGRYVRSDRDGKPEVFLISRVFDHCFPVPALWLEQLRLPVSGNVLRVEMCKVSDTASKSEPLWIVMPDRATGNYQLMVPPGEKLSLQALSAKLESLSSAPFSSALIPAAEAEKLSATHVLNVILISGMTYRLELTERADKTIAGRLTPRLFEGRLPRLTGEADADYKKRETDLKTEALYQKMAFENRWFIVKPDMIRTLSEIPKQ